jgi:peptidoglycan/LPS O-acetylase OafA/YrhL
MKFNLKNTLGISLILTTVAVNIFFFYLVFIASDTIEPEDLFALIGFIFMPSICIFLFLFKTAIKKLNISENKGAKIFGILSFLLACVLACFMIFIMIDEGFDPLALLLLILAFALILYSYLVKSFPFHKIQNNKQLKLRVSFDAFFKTALLVFIGVFLYFFYNYSQNGKYVRLDDNEILNSRTGETFVVHRDTKPDRYGRAVEE